jgi:hypothetical protein
MTPELKPCPFCGGEATLYREGRKFFTGCLGNDCAIQPVTANYTSEAAVYSVWNTRPLESSARKAALLEAAEICKASKDGIVTPSPIGPLHHAGMSCGMSVCEKAIRAAADKRGEAS